MEEVLARICRLIEKLSAVLAREITKREECFLLLGLAWGAVLVLIATCVAAVSLGPR